MYVELLTITSEAEKLIEEAGRTCYKSQDAITDTSYIPFIRSLIRNGHTSVLEHASATFRISGISRACSHQLVRHRLASYSQQSQRNVKQNEFDYVIPKSIQEYHVSGGNGNNALTLYYGIICELQKVYDKLIEFGIPKEDARYILPEGVCTEIVMTMNFREFRHFLKTRLSKKTQWEFRELAGELLKKLKDYCPIVFEDIITE
jgi:thymidylate synthase (FAD)